VAGDFDGLLRVALDEGRAQGLGAVGGGRSRRFHPKYSLRFIRAFADWKPDMRPISETSALLARCTPLLDSVRFAVSYITWATVLAVLSFILPLIVTRDELEGDNLAYALAIGMPIAIQLMTFGAYRLLMTEKKRTTPDLAMFLRAFRSDASSDKLRGWLKAAMGQDWRLGGIRPPAERASFWVTLISPLITGLKYLGSRQFEMVAPDHNWMARLLATFARTRMVFIDIRDVTPHVLDEIRLAWQVFGAKRTVFIIDASKPEHAWKAGLQEHLGCDADEVRLLRWTEQASSFVSEVRSLLGSVPQGTATVPPEALAFVHEKVGDAQWDVRALDKPWVLVLLQQSLMVAAFGLLSLLHPWAMGGAGLLFGLAILLLYKNAWCRARKQRLQAIQINPAGPPSAGRLWGSLVLMLGATGLPLVFVLTVSMLAAHSLADNMKQAKIMTCEFDVSNLQTLLQLYEARCLLPPSTEQGLQALVEKPATEPVPDRWTQLLEEVPKDSWGRPYRYAYPAKRSDAGYDVWSAGPDGIDYTADDIGILTTRECSSFPSSALLAASLSASRITCACEGGAQRLTSWRWRATSTASSGWRWTRAARRAPARSGSPWTRKTRFFGPVTRSNQASISSWSAWPEKESSVSICAWTA